MEYNAPNERKGSPGGARAFNWNPLSHALQRKNCSWQIGTVSIREEDRLATGFRFVNWVHDVPCPEARAAPPPAATNAAYQQIEQWLPMNEKGSDNVLVLTTRTASAQHLQGVLPAVGPASQCRDSGQSCWCNSQALYSLAW